MRLLLVAYYFPPFGAVGAFRVSKLVKYFHRMGWDITVLTVDPKYYSNKDLDYDKLKDIPRDVEIIYTDIFEKNLKFREEGAYWGGKLYKKLLNVTKNNNYDYIYYTAGPFLHLWVAPLIKRISRIPYILDYRDPWLLSPYNNSKKFKLAAKMIEPSVVKNAKYILNVTKDATNIHIDHYKNENNKKFITIENGYDSEDFMNIETEKIDANGIKLIYSGKLGGFRNINNLLDAILKLNKINEEKIYFIHIGKYEDSIKSYIENNIEAGKYIIQKGFLPYKKALSYIKASDIGVIISGGHPYEPTTKIYDYIALNKKILCINDIDYGYLHETLYEYENAVMSKNTEENIEMAINKIINNNLIKVNKNENFSRENIFRRLSEKLILGE